MIDDRKNLIIEPKLRILSLGAGVQSTTMALMAAHGEFEHMPDCAIFADTGWEPKAIYEHLAWLMSPNVLPFPVHIVSAGNIRDDILGQGNSEAHAGKFSRVPWFVEGKDGRAALGRRQCTKEYKLYPLRNKSKELYYAVVGDDTQRKRIPKGSIETWIGISTDEAVRMKPAHVGYIQNRWPLIEKFMNRADCLMWMDRHGYPRPSKSACLGCPFHNDSEWREIRDNTPDEWVDTVAVDKVLRSEGSQRTSMKQDQFMHRSLKPLDEVDLSTAEDHGQLNMFNNECEGMCGV